MIFPEQSEDRREPGEFETAVDLCNECGLDAKVDHCRDDKVKQRRKIEVDMVVM
jgi:hypothetical protein